MEDRRSRPRLYRQLEEYCRSGVYPFHMPGHKRQTDAGFMAEFPNPYSIDITEIDGFDNLHHAEGILRESMDWAASVYSAGRTYYLVNGSTCGVLAAISAAVPRGGTILMARNSHKAAYHAAALNELNIRYIYPQIIEDFGLQGGLLPQDIERMLINADRTSGLPAAVFITSPTYDGVVSDVRGIADICHRYGVPLIVDEAHGAHFPFGEMFPASALEMGADIVIQSLHKTLPAFTQTALLHVRAGSPTAPEAGRMPDAGFISIQEGCRRHDSCISMRKWDRQHDFCMDTECLEYYLQVFQTSSPSYVLMAGIERCIEYMAGEGRDEMQRFAGRLTDLRARLRQMRHLRLLDRDVIGSAGVYDLDISKIIVSARRMEARQPRGVAAEEKAVAAAQSPAGGDRLSGSVLAEMLRRDYRLEMEMCGADYVTAITTLMDSREGLDRLETALLGIDRTLDMRMEAAAGPAGYRSAAGEAAISGSAISSSAISGSAIPGSAISGCQDAGCQDAVPPALPRLRAALPIHEALSCPVQAVPLEAAAGSISGEYVYLYPPGTPVVVPGEILTEETISTIRGYKERHLPVQGLHDRAAAVIRVLAQS